MTFTRLWLCMALLAPLAAGRAQGIPPTPLPQGTQSTMIVGELRAEPADGLTAAQTAAALNRLRSELVTCLVQSRKFAVLDREFGDLTSEEKRANDIDRNKAGETIKQGNEATADYLLTGVIHQLSKHTQSNAISLTGQTYEASAFDLDVNFQVIDVSSRRVVFANSFTAASPLQVGTTAVPFESWIERATRNVAARAVATALEQIYPLTVAAISGDGELILNEGGSRVQVSQVFIVYGVGNVVIDPATGAEAGRDEYPIARALITRVLPKLAYAKLLDPTAKPIAVGSICRSEPTPEPPPIQPATPPKDDNY